MDRIGLRQTSKQVNQAFSNQVEEELKFELFSS